LYNFNADVELAEYSLPVLSNQQPAGAKGGTVGKQGSQSAAGKASSGVINSTQLPPLSGQRGPHPQGIEEEDGMVDEMGMEMEDDEYGAQ